MQLLLQHEDKNSFVLGPQKDIVLLHEIGMISNYIFVPHWVDMFSLIHTVHPPHQTSIFEDLSNVIYARMILLKFTRFVSEGLYRLHQDRAN
jgi:hypothetical protein